MNDTSDWTEGLIRTLIESNLMMMARCDEHGSIVVKYMISGRGPSVVCEKVLALGTSEFDAAQAVLGQMKPNELRMFELPETEKTPSLTKEEVQVAISIGEFKKAELLPGGDLKIHVWNEFVDDWSHQLFRADSEQVQAILEITGPLNVGEVHEFKPGSD